MENSNPKLDKILEKVEDEKTFLEFVKALHNDYKSHEDEWENSNIETFLEAATAWAESTDFGQVQGIKDHTWHRFAVFLYMGKIYE